jgi:hypothetical protein
MKAESFEIFVHGSGRPQVTTARPDETLKEVLGRLEAFPLAGQFVFVGEAVDALQHLEAEADAHEVANIELTLEQLELHKHKHVHVSTRHQVEVIVYFNGQHKRRFSPATTVATVTTWAKKRAHIDPSDGTDLVLALRPNGKHPRPEEHLGELLVSGSHLLEFDLVREVTPQG